MDEDLPAIFRRRLVALLRDELAKVPAFTIEDLLGNDDAMEQLAQSRCRCSTNPCWSAAPR